MNAFDNLKFKMAAGRHVGVGEGGGAKARRTGVMCDIFGEDKEGTGHKVETDGDRQAT